MIREILGSYLQDFAHNGNISVGAEICRWRATGMVAPTRVGFFSILLRAPQASVYNNPS